MGGGGGRAAADCSLPTEGSELRVTRGSVAVQGCLLAESGQLSFQFGAPGAAVRRERWPQTERGLPGEWAEPWGLGRPEVSAGRSARKIGSAQRCTR